MHVEKVMLVHDVPPSSLMEAKKRCSPPTATHLLSHPPFALGRTCSVIARYGSTCPLKFSRFHKTPSQETTRRPFFPTATNLSLGAATNVRQRKFAVPFQWGFDGMNPAVHKAKEGDISSANSFGFDMSNGNASGSLAYKRALGTISDPDFIDILLISPAAVQREVHAGLRLQVGAVIQTWPDLPRTAAYTVGVGGRYRRRYCNATALVPRLADCFIN